MPNDKSYEIMPLFREDGRIHYTNDVASEFDQLGSVSPDNRMSNAEFLNLTKRHNGNIGIVPNNYRNYVESRARNQSTSDRIGNVLAQTVGEIVGGTIESAGSILTLPFKLIGTDEAYTRSVLEQFGSSISEGTRDMFPIYMTEQATSGKLLDRIKGGGYWAQMVPSILGSAASIMLPARGASMLLGKALRTGVNAASKTKYIKDVLKLSKDLQKAKALSRADKIADVYGSAVIGRIIDSSREAYGTYEQEYQWFLDNYSKFVERDANGNAILKAPGKEEVEVNNENIESMAKAYADAAASRGYWRSMSNVGYDILEWMNIMGVAKTLTKATRDNIRKAMASNPKFGLIQSLNAIPAEDKGQLLKSIGGFALGSFSEMADEMTMGISMKEGAHSARKDYGLLSNSDNDSSFGQRLSNYLKDADLWTEGIGGFLGGAGMQAFMPYIENKINKKGIEREQAYLKGLERAVDSMRDGLDGIVESLANGDIIGAKIKEQDAILNQIAANTLDSSLGFYKEMISNMSKSLVEIQAIKNKLNNNEQLTTDEQLLLDNGEHLLANANYFDQILNKIEVVEGIFDRHFNAIQGSNDPVQYEYTRRLATLEAQKKLNELELEVLGKDPVEYQKRMTESKEFLNNYIDTKYQDDATRVEKKVNLTTYAEKNAELENIQSIIDIYDELIAKNKNKISELEKTISELPKDATREQILAKKIMLKSAQGKLDSDNEILKQLSTRLNDLNSEINALKLNNDDKEAAKKAKTLLSNLVNPTEAKTFFESRNTAIDSELNYYMNGDGYNTVKEEIKLYDDEIKASNDKDLVEELDSYKISEELEKDSNKFQDSEQRKAGYEARLKRLKQQEKINNEAIERHRAALNAERAKQEQQTQEHNNLVSETKPESNQAPIGIGTFGRSYKDFDTVHELSADAKALYNQLISESQVTGKSLSSIFDEHLKSTLSAKEQDDYRIVKQYIDEVNSATENSFDALTNIDLKWIVTRLATKYSIFDNIFFGRRFNWEDITTKTDISYDPTVGGDLISKLSNYLYYLSRYTSQVLELTNKPLPSFLAEVHFGLNETTKEDINQLANKIMQEAKSIQAKFDTIDGLIEDNIGRKNPKYNLFVSIGGIEYRVINTTNPRKDVGIQLEGLENQINRYVLTPESLATPNSDYILIARRNQATVEVKQDSAPDQSSSPTGGFEVPQSEAKPNIEVKNETDEHTVEVSEESTAHEEPTSIDFKTASNQPRIDFKIDELDIENLSKFLIELSSQDGVNLELFDMNLLNTLVLIPKLLKSTKGKTKYYNDEYIKDLISKFFTDSKLTKKEQLIIDTAKKVAQVINISIDNNESYIRLNTQQNAKAAADAINNLSSLYSDVNAFYSDTASLMDALNVIAESDMVAKFAEILTNPTNLDSDAIAIRLDESLRNKYALIAQDMGGIFADNFNLYGTLLAFISDRSGFRMTKVNYYDLIDGMREYRGDNNKDLISEIMSIMNIANFLHNEFKNRANYYSARYNATKNQSYKDLYNHFTTFYNMLDVEVTNGAPLTEAQVLDYIARTPEIKSRYYHEGLDISFDPNGAPEDILGNTSTNNLGIYEILSAISVNDEVTLVQTDIEENPNKASYDIILTRDGKEYKLGSLPKLETISNGIAYTILGENNQYYSRKFALTEDMAKVFAEYQRDIFKFMYHYDIAFNPRNNISAKDKLNSEQNIELIFDNFRKERYKKLMDTFKELIYSNLTPKQIKTIMDSETLYGVIDTPYNGSEDGEINLKNVALSFNQIYQICTDLFPAFRIKHSNMDNIINANGIMKYFNESIGIHEMIFKNNQGIRNDIKMTDSNVFRISHIGAGRVLINDEARKEDHETKTGLPIMHHRNSLVNTIKPNKDVVNSNGKPRVQIVYINSEGIAIDPKTGGKIQNVNKFATKHIDNKFIGNRSGMSVIIPQTDSINTLFPVRPNTIMGSITDESEEVRLEKLNKYINYIGTAIKDILSLKEGNITQQRIEISNRLQNVIICNENSSIMDNDIYFQSSNNLNERKPAVMLKTILGDGKGKEQFHKFIQTEIDGREAIIYYTSKNQLDVGNYNGALNHPSYPNKVYYLDNEADIKKFDNVLASIIPNLVRQFGLKDGLAVSKDPANNSYETGYLDPILGERYEDIYEYYMQTNAIYSDVAVVTDNLGNVVSNVTIVGNAPIKFSIASKSYDSKIASNKVEHTQRFYDPVQLLKTVQDASRYKEDWENISKLANILEYEAGIKPVYVKHTVKNESDLFTTKEGNASAIKFNPDKSFRNQFRIDIYYNWKHANKAEHQGYLTRTLAHEMIHTYIMKFFNASNRDINNSELLAKREALIDYNNKEWANWFKDFLDAVTITRNELSTKSELNSREQFLNEVLNQNGIVNKLIEIINREFDTISKSIEEKLKARADGDKVVINGQDAVSEIITYALTDPRVFRLLNELKSTTEKSEDSDSNETPTFWDKFKKVLLNIFHKIFGFTETEVKADSLMERFNETLNRIYNKDYRDMNSNGIIYGIKQNSEAPSREDDVVGSGTSVESKASPAIESESETDTSVESEIEAPVESQIDTTTEEDEDINWDDDYYDVDGNLKLSTILSDSNSNSSTVLTDVVSENSKFLTNEISRYLHDSVVSLNKNSNFDELNKRIC